MGVRFKAVTIKFATGNFLGTMNNSAGYSEVKNGCKLK